jgi:DNA-binding NarL/FixJ family response regulator
VRPEVAGNGPCSLLAESPDHIYSPIEGLHQHVQPVSFSRGRVPVGDTMPMTSAYKKKRENRQTHLTPHEYEVAGWVAQGLSGQEIARKIGRSEASIKEATSRAYHVLKLQGWGNSRVRLALWYLTAGHPLPIDRRREKRAQNQEDCARIVQVGG